MVSGNMNGRLARTGLSVIAALLLSSAAFAQDANEGGSDVVTQGSEPVTDEVAVDPAQTGDDAGGDNQGIAVGEPDPYDVRDHAIVIDDGDALHGGDGPGIGVGEPDLNDGGIPPGDDGTSDDWTGDDGTGDDWTGEDGTGDDGTGDDGTGDDWVWSDDDTLIWIDDGLCIGVGCVPGEEVTLEDGGYVLDGEVVIYYMYGPRPEDCPECRDNTGVPVEILQMSNGGVIVPDPEAVPAAKPRRARSAASLAGNAAECLALYPQMPWLCEWQNGAGQ